MVLTLARYRGLPWIPIQSTVLHAVARTGDKLWAEFLTDEVYLYYAVPDAVFEELLAAESKGSYFNRAIRGKFLFQHVLLAQEQ